MRATELPIGPLLAAVLLGLVTYAGLVAATGRLGLGRPILTRADRAVAQLAGVSLIITAVLCFGQITAAFGRPDVHGGIADRRPADGRWPARLVGPVAGHRQ